MHLEAVGWERSLSLSKVSSKSLAESSQTSGLPENKQMAEQLLPVSVAVDGYQLQDWAAETVEPRHCSRKSFSQHWSIDSDGYWSSYYSSVAITSIQRPKYYPSQFGWFTFVSSHSREPSEILNRLNEVYAAFLLHLGLWKWPWVIFWKHACFLQLELQRR